LIIDEALKKIITDEK